MSEYLNQDFTKRVVVNTLIEEWHTSPSSGVERLYLERDNMGEFAKASSIVKFQPGSEFEDHMHDNGEEIFVLEGIFSDQYGDYPKGTYLRNPHNSNHVPFSKDGCKIFVKLRQFKKGDNISIVKNTLSSEWLQGLVPGLKVMPLHEYQTEHAAMVKWEPNTRFNAHKHWGGEEIYVVDGVFYDQFGAYPKGTWIRSPHLSAHQPFTRSEGALIFVKTGHL
jgi:anti-sigma factor ChrR (cupin superfamily)